MIPPVVASDRGTAQTSDVAMRRWGSRTATLYSQCEQNVLERTAIAGDSPVSEAAIDIAVS